MHSKDLSSFAGQLVSFLAVRTNVGLALIDSHNRVQAVNPAFIRIAGAPEHRWIGQPVEEVITPSSRDTFSIACEQATENASVDLNLTILSFDGTARQCQVRIWHKDNQKIVLFEEEGNPEFACDITTGAETPEVFMQQLVLEIYRSGRYRRTLAVLKCEVDGMSGLFEQYGEETGSRVLAMISWTLRRLTRRTDLVARVSSSQFAILLPETDWAGAMVAATKLSSGVRQLAVDTPSGAVKPSVTFGVVATADVEDTSPQTLMEAVDWALSVAKHRGPGGIEAAPAAAFKLAI